MEFTTAEIDFKDFLLNIFDKTHHGSVMFLTLFVDGDDELKNKYMEAAKNHNNKLFNDPCFYDAGFDLFLPKSNTSDSIKFFTNTVNKVDFKVKCCAKMFKRNNNKQFYTPFYTYARSSISKTPLRLANNQGIIDAGYRGSIIGMFDCIYRYSSIDSSDTDYCMEEYSRILQICAPGLAPVYVNIVYNIEELGPNTSRGEGGFGSTGK